MLIIWRWWHETFAPNFIPIKSETGCFYTIGFSYTSYKYVKKKKKNWCDTTCRLKAQSNASRPCWMTDFDNCRALQHVHVTVSFCFILGRVLFSHHLFHSSPYSIKELPACTKDVWSIQRLTSIFLPTLPLLVFATPFLSYCSSFWTFKFGRDSKACLQLLILLWINTALSETTEARGACRTCTLSAWKATGGPPHFRDVSPVRSVYNYETNSNMSSCGNTYRRPVKNIFSSVLRKYLKTKCALLRSMWGIRGVDRSAVAHSAGCKRLGRVVQDAFVVVGATVEDPFVALGAGTLEADVTATAGVLVGPTVALPLWASVRIARDRSAVRKRCSWSARYGHCDE